MAECYMPFWTVVYSTELTNSAERFSRHRLSRGCQAVPGHVAGLHFGLLYFRNEEVLSWIMIPVTTGLVPRSEHLLLFTLH